jgi:hypothetical protein
MHQRNISIKEEEAMSRSPVIMAVLALITPALAAELPKSGSFKTPSAFKGMNKQLKLAGVKSRRRLWNRNRGQSAAYKNGKLSLY